MSDPDAVSDIVDGPMPIGKLQVTYPGVEVVFGGELSPSQVKNEPQVKWDAEYDKYYLLAMVDPDAPSKDNPIFAEVNHWLVGNIKGSDVSTGDVIAEYRGSMPGKGNGLHRYIFLVYEQKGKSQFDEPYSSKTSREHRLKFSIKKFSNKYNLKSPVHAGNYFQAQWDPSVDEIKKEMGE